jgi:3-hydroxyacyl-[acyl-carrier-protein] dehydratase
VIIEHHEIKQYLRQRYPLLLVDRVLEITEDYVVGLKNVTATDPCLQGHFPDEPLFPGVFLIEAMSQVGGILMAFKKTNVHQRKGYLAKVDKVKFTQFIRPGDQIVMTAEHAESFGNVARARVTAKVADQSVGQGEVTYYFEK